MLCNYLVIDRTTYRFRVDNRYLFVSRKNTTDNQKVDQHSRRLYVSNNYDSENGAVGFIEVQLPSLKDQQVLELHVQHVLYYNTLYTHCRHVMVLD